MGFKATLHLCQVAAGERLPAWLEAGIGAAWQWLTMHGCCTAQDSTCVRLTVITTYGKLTHFFKQIYILVSFEAIHCVKLISCKIRVRGLFDGVEYSRIYGI